MQKGVVPQMKACLACVFGHVITKLNPSSINYCFELFGIDFMLDDQGQAYLIEINTSPALFRKGAYLQVCRFPLLLTVPIRRASPPRLRIMRYDAPLLLNF
jgi:hypothetical protein